MSSRDRLRDDSASSVEEKRNSRARADHSDEQSVAHRRRGGHERKRGARKHDRCQGYDNSDNEREARPSRHRSERSNDDTRRRRKDDYSQRDHGRIAHSRSPDRSQHRRRSRSPAAKKRRRSYNVSKSRPRKSRADLQSQDESLPGEKRLGGADAPPEKQKPNFKPTGLLAKEANTVAGTTTVLKYHEPPEARKPPPKEQWRMYIFKEKDLLDTIYLHQRSVWLCGRDQKVTDLLLEHPSISKQHAVIQFRYLTTTNEYGDKSSKVKPYLIDLDSANGTKLNGKRMEGSRFVELIDADVIAFGDSEREYVLMLPPAA